MIDTQIEVVGIKDALRELNTIDKRLRRQVTADFRQIMKPATDAARNLVPLTEPMTGFARQWDPRPGIQTASSDPVLPWSTKQRRNVDAYISGRRPRTVGNVTRDLTAFGMRWKSPAAVLFDTARNADTESGRRMVNTLTARFGPASRTMWAAWQRTEPAVRASIADLVNRIMEAVNRDIRVRG